MNGINKWLDGKKTIIGALGILFAGLGVLFAAIVAHGLQMADVLVFVKIAAAAMIALGFGGKLQKLIDEFSASK